MGEGSGWDLLVERAPPEQQWGQGRWACQAGQTELRRAPVLLGRVSSPRFLRVLGSALELLLSLSTAFGCPVGSLGQVRWLGVEKWLL